MPLRLFRRSWRLPRLPRLPLAGSARQGGAHPQPAARGAHRKTSQVTASPGLTPQSATRAGPPGRAAARAAVRLPPDAEARSAAATATAPGSAASRALASRSADAQHQAATVAAAIAAAVPWYAAARPGGSAAGRRDCGCLEALLVREWAADADPSPAAVTAVNRLAALPLLIKEKLAAGLDAIYVGEGGVPDVDDMGGLAGVPLPSGRATWDACAGAYGDRKIIVATRPSPTPDVMCHEVGHALDDIDGADDKWQSDSAGFRALYATCLPHLASQFHRQGDSVGRREFFADAFAAIASSQRPALVEMLSGDTRTALDVMLYFNVRYGI